MTRLDDRLETATAEVERYVERLPRRSVVVLRHRHRRHRIATATSGVVILVVWFAGGALLLTGDADRPVAGSAPAQERQATIRQAIADGRAAASSVPRAEDQSPTTTAVAGDIVYDSEAARAWSEWVTEALVLGGWDREVTTAYETAIPVTDGGSITAVVRDGTGRLVLVVDLQAWAPGEYHADPAWQQEVAGSNHPGRVTADGVVFVAYEHPSIRIVTLVNEEGLLTVKAEETPTDPLPTNDALETLALALTSAMTAVVPGS